MDDYQGSIAQENVSFGTSVALETVPGDNFYKLMVFVGLSQAGESLVDVPVGATLLQFTAANYATETKGKLKLWLQAFFAGAGNAGVFIVIFDDLDGSLAWDEVGLIEAFTEYKSLAYWKAMCYYPKSGGSRVLTEQDYTAYAALASLQKSDPMLTGPILLNEYDADIFTTPANTLSGQLTVAGLDAFSIYHPEALDKAPVFVQLGVTLGFLNDSGTPVGNSLDYVATLLISASGEAGANLSPTDQTSLRDLNVGYFKTVGNGTGQVALVGGESLLGRVIAADWIVSYNDYYNSIRVAELITRMNVFKNRATYNLILSIMSTQLNRFADTVGIGRLTNLQITAPIFSKLPPAAGDTIVIPNAWRATYVDNVREVQVQGSLIIGA